MNDDYKNEIQATRNKIYKSLNSVLEIADKIDLNLDAACDLMFKLGFPTVNSTTFTNI